MIRLTLSPEEQAHLGTDAPYPATPRRALSLCLTQCAGLECPTDCPAFKPQRAHHSYLAQGISEDVSQVLMCYSPRVSLQPTTPT